MALPKRLVWGQSLSTDVVAYRIYFIDDVSALLNRNTGTFLVELPASARSFDISSRGRKYMVTAVDIDGEESFVGSSTPLIQPTPPLAPPAVEIVDVETGPPTPAEDTEFPTGSITEPEDLATVSAVQTIEFTASDNEGIQSVQVQVNGLNHGTPFTQVTSGVPQSLPWDTTIVSDGVYSIRAIIIDTSGNQTTTDEITVTVDNDQGVIVPTEYPAADAGASYPTSFIGRDFAVLGGATHNCANTAEQ